MITINDFADAPLFEKTDTEIQMVITIEGKADVITNDLLYDEFDLEESICSEETLFFGRCEASQVRFSMSTTAVAYSLRGKTIYIKLYLNGHSNVLFNVGTYKVTSDVKDSNTDKRTITAYDALHEINEADMTDWYNTFLPNADSTSTIALMRASFFSHFGITEETETLVNDSMIVRKTVEGEIYGKDIISWICEANGVFGHITRDGTFKYVDVVNGTQPLFPAEDLFPADDLYPSDGNNRVLDATDTEGGYIDGHFENYSVQIIDELEILAETGDVGQTIGSGTNIYTIAYNPLFYGMSAGELTTYGTRLFNKIKNATYIPYELTALGNPCFEVGDGVICQTYNGIIHSYILNRTLSGVQSLEDTYIASGTETYTKDFDNIRSEVKALTNKGNILRRDVDQTLSEIYDGNHVSRILQNANSISAEITNRQNADDALGLRIDGVNQNLLLYVKFGESYSGIEITKTKVHIKTGGTFQVDAGNLIITENGDVTVKGRIEANSGNIGVLEITADGLELDSQPVLIQDAQNRLLVGNPTKTTAIYGSRFVLFGGDLRIDTGVSGKTDIEGDVWLEDNVEIGGSLAQSTLTYNGTNVYWQKLSDILNNANAYVLTDVAS